MNNLLSLILKHKLSNKIFTFLCTIVIFTLASVISAGVFVGIGAFLTIFISGGVALKVIEWCDKEYKELNNIK